MEKLFQTSSLNFTTNYATKAQNSNFKTPNFQNSLERTPKQDTTSFCGKISEEDLNGDINIEVSNGFLGLGKRKITGTILGKQVNLTLDTGNFNLNKVKLSGTIAETPVSLEMNDYKLSGDISDEHKDVLPYLKRLMVDKRNYDTTNTMIVAAC